MDIFLKRASPKPTKVYETFWKFAAERQEIFFRRLSGAPGPWTQDSILARHKFTNAYRASDRVSQYLIRNVIYNGDQSPDEVFFRCILFKIFNRESTWDLLTKEFGDIRYSSFSFGAYCKVLGQAMQNGQRVFSAAYIMPSRGADFRDPSKHRNYLSLLSRMMKDSLPSRLAEAPSMASVFELLLAYPLIGAFLGYQFATDLNYSTLMNFSEMEFVMAGPGARDGIRKCFVDLGGYAENDVIRLVTERQNDEFRNFGLPFRSLWGRPLQLIDCQNLFCEVSKYARLAHPDVKGVSDRKRIKQKFTPYSQVIHPWYPPKWGLNEQIQKAEVAPTQAFPVESSLQNASRSQVLHNTRVVHMNSQL